MIEGVSLESMVGYSLLGISLGKLIGNIFAYMYTSSVLNNTKDRDYAKDISINALRAIDSYGWLNQNLNNTGKKFAYERFLERNK